MASTFDELLELAVDNHGYLTVNEAEAAGLDPVQLRALVATGRLERWSHGAYRIPVLASGPHAICAEAVDWTRGRGVVSHESALDLLDLCEVNPPRIHLTVPAAYGPRRRGGELYRLWQREAAAAAWFSARRGVRVIDAVFGTQNLVGSQPGPVRAPELDDCRTCGTAATGMRCRS